MPLSAVWAGDAVSPHLEAICGVGTAHVTCSTTGATPFRLHLVGDVGHTLILGPTGAAKSTLLGLLALQWLRYPGAQVLVFDKDPTSRIVPGSRQYRCAESHQCVHFDAVGRVDGSV